MIPSFQDIIATPSNRLPSFEEIVARNEAERGFLEKIAESFKRGQDISASVAVGRALLHPEEGKDLIGLLRIQDKLKRKEALDPIEGNFLTDLVYGGARMIGQMYESFKAGLKPALTGAASGAGMAAVAAAAIPAPDEPITIPAGAAIGFKTGMAMGATFFWYYQGIGDMYYSILQKGVDPKIASRISQVAAIPYAVIENLQVGKLTPKLKQELLKRTSRKITPALLRGLKKYGKTLSEEVLQELEQEAIQIAAEDTASYLNKKGLKVDKKYLLDRAKRLYATGVGAAKAFALLPGVRAVAETAHEQAMLDAAALVDEAKEKEITKMLAGPPTFIETAEGFLGEDIIDNLPGAGDKVKITHTEDPVLMLQSVVKDSIEQWKAQEQLRHVDRVERFAVAEKIRQTYEGPGWKYAMRNALRGPYAELKIEPNRIPLEVYEQLDAEIRASNLKTMEASRAGEALDKLVKEGRLLRPNEAELLGKVFGRQFEDSMKEAWEIAGGKRVGKAKFNFWDYWNLPKAVSASCDLSRNLRQHILTLAAHPKLWYKNLVTEWQILLSDEETAKALEKAAQTSRYASLRRRTRLKWNTWGEEKTYWTGAERFATRLTAKLPGVKISEIAYSAGGNLHRAALFDMYAEEWEGTGKTMKDYDDLAHIINIVTGEGDARIFGKFAPALNAIFFAPRLTAARVQAVYELVNPRLSWAARKILAYHIVSFVALNTTMLSLFSLVPGVHVEIDPRSTDWGKIRIKNMRIDFWGGYLPLARAIIRLITQQRKTRTERIVPQPVSDTIVSFLQSKLGPVPASVLDVIRGETFYGEDVTLDSQGLLEQFYHRFAPFFVQDIIDAIHYQGLGTALAVAPLTFHGVGVQTYPLTPAQESLLLKNRISLQVMGRKWDDIGPVVQQLLRENFPQIDLSERKIRYETERYDYLNRIEEERRKTGKEIYNSLRPDIREELDSLQIKVGGLGRKIGTDWYLNDKRFADYKKTVSILLNKLLTPLIRSPRWDALSNTMKREIIETMIADIKKAARQKVSEEASLQDIIHLKEYMGRKK